MLGSALGFPVTLCVPSNVSPERKNILAAYGANVIWTNPAEGSDGAIRKVRSLVAEDPDRYFYADQYGNDQNWLAHYRGTANEIWEQTEGQSPTSSPASAPPAPSWAPPAASTSSTRSIKCISMQPDSPFNGFEGLKHMATAIVPRIYDPEIADQAHLHGNRTRLRHGPRARPQPRHAGRRLRRRRRRHLAHDRRRRRHAHGREAVIVTILCDAADKYLSERFWTEG